MKYTVQFFIDKFEKIPENDFGQSCLHNHCALWHCGVRESDNDEFGGYTRTDESFALAKLLNPKHKNYGYIETIIYSINDSAPQSTPRARILAALYDIKKMQEPKEQPYSIDLTKQLAVLPSDRREVDVVKEPLKILI